MNSALPRISGMNSALRREMGKLRLRLAADIRYNPPAIRLLLQIVGQPPSAVLGVFAQPRAAVLRSGISAATTRSSRTTSTRCAPLSSLIDLGWWRQVHWFAPWRVALTLLIIATIWGLVDVRRRSFAYPDMPGEHKSDLTVYTGAGAAFFDGREPYEVCNPRDGRTSIRPCSPWRWPRCTCCRCRTRRWFGFLYVSGCVGGRIENAPGLLTRSGSVAETIGRQECLPHLSIQQALLHLSIWQYLPLSILRRSCAGSGSSPWSPRSCPRSIVCSAGR